MRQGELYRAALERPGDHRRDRRVFRDRADGLAQGNPVGDGRRAFTFTARPASARCAPPNSTSSACAASAASMRISATAFCEDDDEVAVLHGPEELGYPPGHRGDGQHPRDTRRRQSGAGMIDAATWRPACTDIAKDLFYKAAQLGGGVAGRGGCRAAGRCSSAGSPTWLPQGRVDRSGEEPRRCSPRSARTRRRRRRRCGSPTDWPRRSHGAPRASDIDGHRLISGASTAYAAKHCIFAASGWPIRRRAGNVLDILRRAGPSGIA